MAQKMLLAATAAIALFISAGAGVAFPAAPMQTVQPTSITKVTFWARSFPYGYRWSLARACTRYESVETSRGPVIQRVWVCGHRRDTVVSYRG